MKKGECGRWKIDPPAGGGRWRFDGLDLREVVGARIG